MKKKITFYLELIKFLKNKWLVILLLTGVINSQSNAAALASKMARVAKRTSNSTASRHTSFAGERVVGFTLINANNNGEIQKIANGATLNLANLPTRSLSIRADTDPSTVGSVIFNLSGAQSHTQLQTEKPYALFGDAKGDYYPW